MRLIDADALKDAMNYNGGCGICFMYVDDASTIDAIPVEWIISWSNKRYRETQKDVSIVDVLEGWQEEQEART